MIPLNNVLCDKGANADVLAATVCVLESGRYVAGEKVAKFEEAWAHYCGADYCAGVASGGAALTLTLRALQVPPGARVIVPALTFAATGMAVLEAGAQPVFCDVDEHGLMDVNDAARVAEDCRPWGIVPVHLYGQLADMEAVTGLAARHNMYVIEDAAQAHGALREVSGIAACFSFYPGKNLGACGEAGAVVSHDASVIARVKRVANYGDAPGRKHQHLLLGGNYRMDELQAAILYAKLPFLNIWNAVRKQAAQHYRDNGVESIATDEGHECSWHLYPTRVKGEPEVYRNQLAERGISTGRHYPKLLPEIPSLFQPGFWPNALQIARNHISLPMGPHLTERDVDYISGHFLELEDDQNIQED